VVIFANRSELLLQTMAMSCDPIQLANASLEIHPSLTWKVKRYLGFANGNQTCLLD
jgi:hypothetical protein